MKEKEKENLSMIHTVDGARITNEYGEAVIRSKTIGLLSLPTGQIAIADATTNYHEAEFKRKVLSKSVAPGVYPIDLYIAEDQHATSIAFCEIRFTNNQPVKWTAAKTIFDTENKRKGYFGYIVNHSRTGFMDAKAFAKITELSKRQNTSEVFFEDDEDDDIRIDGVKYRIHQSKDDECNAITIDVHSGCYYWYWGMDKSGKICCLIADFFTYV